MKPKAAITPRSRTPKGKIVKKEPPSEESINVPGATYNVPSSMKPSVEIVKCISFQKFRYSGENRPGKKYQEKEFMTLRLSHLQDKVVRVVIICTDADNRELIHPNGLVGKDCHDGIYDKEYAVTKQFYLIKIPYLRTERMKTKKNEHKNILGVLSSRASHLPSPYRERCLSQCTDKYTSSREKFDTTKVCLGVIVTVESHQGILNGSLHAISHVVRNASEKTSLSILKLSNDSVPASTGAFIDIFTTEDGPALEPDKYLVYVSSDSDVHGMESWQSVKHSPGKEDLLYKRVITFQVPPFEPDPHLSSPLEVNLHLECPQSNQYCTTRFQYVPPREMVIFEDEAFIGGQKRSYIEHDIKPSPKKLRTEYDNDGSTESIKANLKTKIKARNETPNSLRTISIDSQGDAQGEEESPQYISEHNQQKVYSQECPVLIHHQDPQTGESSYLLDMDSTKSSNSNEAAAYVGEKQYFIQFQGKSPKNHLQDRNNVKVSASMNQLSSQDFKVVSTEYSDTVPTNTVLVYDRADDGTLEQVIIHSVSDDNHIIFTQSPGFRHGNKHVSVFASDGAPASSSRKGSSGEIIQGGTIAERRSTNYTSNLSSQDCRLEEIQPDSDCSVPTSDNRLAASLISHNSNTSNSMTSSNSPFVDRFSHISTSFPSAIPPIRRMLIPSKAISSASPWEVDNGDDSVSDYDSVVRTFEMPNKRTITLKGKPLDENPVRQRNEFYTSPSTQTYQRIVHIPEKQLRQMGEQEYNKENGNRDDVRIVASEVVSATTRDDPVGTSNSAGLSSMDVEEAITTINNLPTMKIFEIAEHLEDMSSNVTTEEEA